MIAEYRGRTRRGAVSRRPSDAGARSIPVTSPPQRREPFRQNAAAATDVEALLGRRMPAARVDVIEAQGIHPVQRA